MATTFPENLDVFVNPQPNDSVQIVSHAAQHADANDAISALQSKVGVDNSLDPNSLDYKVRALENASLDTEGIQDIVAALIGSGSHTNISIVYDDDNNQLNFSASLDSEAAMDAIAAAFTAGTGIVKEYDDELDTITISVDTSTIATQEFVTTTASAVLTDANEYTDIAISGLSNQIGEGYVPISAVGNVDGVAQLDENGFVPNEQLNIDERVQDTAALMFTSATHNNITVSYDDETGKISLSAAGGGGGASVTVSSNPPAEPSLGDLWLDSDNARAYAYDGEFWAEIGSGGQLASISSEPPASAVQGSIWVDSDTGKSYIYDGMYWVEI